MRPSLKGSPRSLGPHRGQRSRSKKRMIS